MTGTLYLITYCRIDPAGEEQHGEEKAGRLEHAVRRYRQLTADDSYYDIRAYELVPINILDRETTWGESQ